MSYIRAKHYIPSIGFLYCDENGMILEEQTKPNGDIVDNVSNEELMSDIRQYRNSLLYMSDWTQLQDAPLSAADIEKWKAYRQALRDFPEKINVEDWTGPAWPVVPE